MDVWPKHNRRQGMVMALTNEMRQLVGERTSRINEIDSVGPRGGDARHHTVQAKRLVNLYSPFFQRICVFVCLFVCLCV